LKEVKREFPESPEIERLVVFIERSQRGICR